jgi:hyperosmotically inducible protein
MKTLFAIVLAGIASTCYAAADEQSDAYHSAMKQAAADYKTARANCDTMKGNARTICVDEAHASRAHSEADAMAANNQGSERARSRALTDAADADYALARAKCGDKTGNDKTSCMDDARSTHTAAIAEAKSNRSMAANQGNSTSGTSATSGTSGTTGTSGTSGATGSSGTTSGTTSSDNTASTSGNTSGSNTNSTTGRAGEVVADSVITARVKGDLVKERDLSASAIHVETNKGVVMLSGFVNSKAEADKAVELARTVKGVKQVESAIKVK